MLTTAINGGIVVDVIQKTRHRRNLGILNGKIVQISEKPLEAEEVIHLGGWSDGCAGIYRCPRPCGWK